MLINLLFFILGLKLMEKDIILTEEGVSQSIDRMAREIAGRNADVKDMGLVGIRTGGAFLAARLQKVIESLVGATPPVGILDITLYRDDWTKIAPTPVVGKTELGFSLEDRVIVLVDDVLFTGRTVRAAMDALIDYGRPKKIELAILVDRGDAVRELPIKPHYVGTVCETEPWQTVNVYLMEEGYPDHATVEGRKANQAWVQEER